MEQAGDNAKEKQNHEEDGMAVCTIRRMQNKEETEEIVIGEEKGKAPIGKRTLQGQIKDLKEEIKSGIKWWEEEK